MGRSCFGDGVHDGPVVAAVGNDGAGDRADDDNAGGRRMRPGRFEEGKESGWSLALTMMVGSRDSVQAHEVEDTADIQVDNLLARPVRGRLERTAPCRSGIRNQDIELWLDFFHLVDQGLDFIGLGGASRDANRLALDSGQSIELSDRLLDAGCFARCYKDGFRAGSQKRRCYMQADTAGSWAVSIEVEM